MREPVLFSSAIAARSSRCVTLRRMPRALQAHSCHETPTRQVDVGQPGDHERACGVLGQTSVAHLVEASQELDHGEHMLDL
jgi:hypothetical protein